MQANRYSEGDSLQGQLNLRRKVLMEGLKIGKSSREDGRAFKSPGPRNISDRVQGSITVVEASCHSVMFSRDVFREAEHDASEIGDQTV